MTAVRGRLKLLVHGVELGQGRAGQLGEHEDEAGLIVLCIPRSKKRRGGFAVQGGTEIPPPLVDADSGCKDAEGICSDVHDGRDGALLVVGSGLLQPVPRLVDDVPLG